MQRRVSLPDLLSLNAYWVGLSFLWNSLHPIVLPAVLLTFVPEDQKNSYLGLLTGLGLFIAMLVQPAAGAFSDRWLSYWGRRRPLIVVGVALSLASLGVIAISTSLAMLVIGYIALQISSNIAQAPMQGLLPDRVPPAQLGRASALKNLMDMAGLIIASFAAGRLIDPNGQDPTLVMGAIIGVLAFSSAITLFITDEEPTAPEGYKPLRIPLAEVFRVDVRRHSSYWWLMGTRFLFLIGVYGVQAFAQYFLRDVLRLANPAQATGDLLATIGVMLIAFAVGGGWATDRFGAKPVMVAASILGGTGSLLLVRARSITELLIYGAIFGAGVGLFLTSNWALANRLAPLDEAGKFLGLSNLATAGAGALTRLQGPAIDSLNASQPGTYLGYTALFVSSAVVMYLSAALLLGVRERRGEPVPVS